MHACLPHCSAELLMQKGCVVERGGVPGDDDVSIEVEGLAHAGRQQLAQVEASKVQRALQVGQLRLHLQRWYACRVEATHPQLSRGAGCGRETVAAEEDAECLLEAERYEREDAQPLGRRTVGAQRVDDADHTRPVHTVSTDHNVHGWAALSGRGECSGL